MSINIHKRQAQVAVLGDEEEVTEEVRIANPDLNEISQNTREVVLRWKPAAPMWNECTSFVGRKIDDVLPCLWRDGLHSNSEYYKDAL